MKIKDVFKEEAQKIQLLLQELRPDWEVSLIEEDVNLFRLGFVKDIPCSLSINAPEEDIEALLDEIYDMETDAYINEEIIEREFSNMIIEEKLMRNEVIRALEKYRRYQVLEGYLVNLVSE